MAADFGIKRFDDKSLFELFDNVKKAGEAALLVAQESKVLRGGQHKITLAYGSGLPWAISEEDLSSALPGQYLIATILLTFTAYHADGGQGREEQVNFRVIRGKDQMLSDTLTINSSSQINVMNGEGEQLVQKAIHKSISKLLQPVAPEDGGLVPTLSNLAESFSTTYQRIAVELSDAVAAVSKERADQLTEFQEERARLRKEIADEKSAMHEKNQKELKSSRDEIAIERAELDRLWDKLEVSSHKDARRKQFSKLQEDLHSTLQEPVADKELRRTRWAVFLAILFSAVAAAYFAYLSITSPVSGGDSTAMWLFPAVRTLILTFASLASFLGAAAWLRYFYNRDLSAQEETRRFRNDMARASWVMDAALEIRKEHNEVIPPEWISGVTEGLFAARKRDTLEEGAQALAALMGLSASASFGPNGTTVELSKSGGRKISSAAKE